MAYVTFSDGSDDALERFLDFSQDSIERYQYLSEGMMVADCRKRLGNDGEVCFRVELYGSLSPPFCFSIVQLQEFDNYVSQRFTTDQEPYPLHRWLISILEILQKTGHGRVVLQFERARKGMILVRVAKTISEQRHLPKCSDLLK